MEMLYVELTNNRHCNIYSNDSDTCSNNDDQLSYESFNSVSTHSDDEFHNKFDTFIHKRRRPSEINIADILTKLAKTNNDSCSQMVPESCIISETYRDKSIRDSEISIGHAHDLCDTVFSDFDSKEFDLFCESDIDVKSDINTEKMEEVISSLLSSNNDSFFSTILSMNTEISEMQKI